jgi:hypothetical protein
MRRTLPTEVSTLLADFSRDHCWFCHQRIGPKEQTSIHHVFPQNFFPRKCGNSSGVQVHSVCHKLFHQEHPGLRGGTEARYLRMAKQLDFGLGIYQPPTLRPAKR